MFRDSYGAPTAPVESYPAPTYEIPAAPAPTAWPAAFPSNPGNPGLSCSVALNVQYVFFQKFNASLHIILDPWYPSGQVAFTPQEAPGLFGGRNVLQTALQVVLALFAFSLIVQVCSMQNRCELMATLQDILCSFTLTTIVS